MRRDQNSRAGIEPLQTRQKVRQPRRALGQIGFRHHQPVGDRGLFHRLLMRVERRLAIHRVDQRHHAVEPIAQHQIRMIHDRVQTGRGIGKAGRLQHDAAEWRDAVIVAFAQQVFQRGDEIAANRAADAAGTHHDHVAVDVLDEQMIESDVAKFVDEHESVGELRRR